MQQIFLDTVMAGRNAFLTGKAGTGKSFVLREAINRLRAAKKRVAAIAPTGIAANNIDGQTIHSLFKLNPFGVMSFEACNFVKSETREVLANTDVFVIDEVSMLRPDILDGMHWTLKKNGCPGLETKQVIFVGDLKQLPCVIDDNTRSVLYQTYNGDDFTYAQIYRRLSPITVELSEVLRQENEEFIEHLNTVRDGGRSEYFRRFVSVDTRGIILAPHNATVAQYNKDGLNRQAGEAFVFDAKIAGTVKPEEFPLEQQVIVKNGCKIMYLVNSQNNPLRNGTLGIFVSHAGCHFIRVGETDFALEPVTLTKKQYVFNKEEDYLELREIGSITQYPIKLAYALSIHKAQGLTFNEVTVDLRRSCFMKGQLYVALSRVTSPEGLTIIAPS